MNYKQARISGHCPDGWVKLVDPLIAMCNAEGVEIDQIKEKLGGLRFYVVYGPDAKKRPSEALVEAIHKAQEESFRVCLSCGEPGRMRSPGWMRTLCDRHEEYYKIHSTVPGRS